MSLFRRFALLCLATSLLVAVSSANGSTKEPRGKKPGANQAAGKGAARRTGRMARFYTDVADEAQREKIRAIRQTYEPKFARLRAELQALEMEQEKAMSAVLTPKQRDKVETLKAEAKSKGRDGRRRASP